MMNVRSLQRNVKNVVNNYSEAQVKVREATSNDPWGPSSTLMSEIADLTYNVVAFSEIMQMIWKRLNDHGKNWRHVYKALVLLEYLIKTGSEKVAQQCKENIFAIQTLKDFQYTEENKDQGLNVREKSKSLVSLLKDDEKLKNERARALKAKERFAQCVSYMSSSPSAETLPKSASCQDSLAAGLEAASKDVASDLENARPQTIGEEELQLQLALAMSKEEAEQEERLRKNDDLRLQLALTESQRNAKAKAEKKSAMDDLLSLSVGPTVKPSDPWSPVNNNDQGVVAAAVGGGGGGGSSSGGGSNSNGLSGNGVASVVGLLASNDPWSPSPTNNVTPKNDPWGSTNMRSESANNDPWHPSPHSTTPVSTDPWSPGHCDRHSSSANGTKSPATMFDLSAMSSETQINKRNTPESFLGPNSNLVNLDALVSTRVTPCLPVGGNPFQPVPAATSNPFQAVKPPPPTINQLRSQNQFVPGMDVTSANPTVGQFHQTNAVLLGAHPAGVVPPMNPPSVGNNPFAM